MPQPTNLLPLKSKFAGESFGTGPQQTKEESLIRIVYVGASEDQLPLHHHHVDRAIILLGTNTHTSNLIDFMCNLFYGVHFESEERVHIANECFDSKTTPRRPITKYVFNEAGLVDFRPILIQMEPNDSEGGKLIDLLGNFPPSLEVHSIALVIPSNEIREEKDEKEVKSSEKREGQSTRVLTNRKVGDCFAAIITMSESEVEPYYLLFSKGKRLLDLPGLFKHTVYRTNTTSLFERPSDNSLERQQQEFHWRLTSENLRKYFHLVNRLKPQQIGNLILILKSHLEMSQITQSSLSPDSAIGIGSSRRETQEEDSKSPLSPEVPENSKFFIRDLPIRRSSNMPLILGPEATKFLVEEDPLVITLPSPTSGIAGGGLGSGTRKRGKEGELKSERKLVICEQESAHIVKEVELIKKVGGETTNWQSTRDEKAKWIQVDHRERGEESNPPTSSPPLQPERDLHTNVFRRYIFDPTTLSYRMRYAHEVRLSSESTTTTNTSLSSKTPSPSLGKDQPVFQTAPPERRNSFTDFSQNPVKNSENPQGVGPKIISSSSFTDLGKLPPPPPPPPTKRLRFRSPQPPPERPSSFRRAFERHSTSRRPLHPSGTTSLMKGPTGRQVKAAKMHPPLPVKEGNGEVNLTSEKVLRELLKPLSSISSSSEQRGYWNEPYVVEKQTAPLLTKSPPIFSYPPPPPNKSNSRGFPMDLELIGSANGRLLLPQWNAQTPSGKAPRTKSKKKSSPLMNYCYYLLLPFLLILLAVAGIVAVIHYI